MEQIKAPFTKDQVDKLNEYQKQGMFHPFTCKNDGNDAHIKYEFEKEHKGEDYNEYLIKEKANGINFPEMRFNQTNLIATENGWICPVCNYEQNWAHKFMTEEIKPLI